MFETVIHTLGFCGEPHPKGVDLLPMISYITEYKTAFAYTLKNTWHNLNIF